MPNLQLSLQLQSNGLQSSSYTFTRVDAETYYNYLVVEGLTPTTIQTLYSLSENAFKQALDTFFIDLAAAGSVPTRLWLFIGDTENTQVVEAAFGSIGATDGTLPTFDKDGMLFNGTDNYYDTGVAPNIASGSMGAAFGGFNDSASRGVFGATSGAASSFFLRQNGTPAWEGRAYGSTTPPTATRGVKTRVAVGTSGGTASIYLDGTTTNGTGGGTAPSVHSVFLGAVNSTGTAINFSPIHCGFLFMDTGAFNSTKIANWFTAYDTFKTTLGRTH